MMSFIFYLYKLKIIYTLLSYLQDIRIFILFTNNIVINSPQFLHF